MKSRLRSKSVLISLLFVALSSGLLFAQDDYGAPAPPTATITQDDPGQPAQDQGQPAQQDPPGRVARVQYMSGEVSMQPGGANDWIAASQNRPLTTADRIWTDKNSRAELNVGDGFIRMSAETSLTLANVSDRNVQLELDQGVLQVTVRHLEPGEIYEVDTPNYAFTVMKSGVYRFDVYPSEDQSWVTVRSGYGEATGRGNAVRVNSGMQVRFSGGNSLQHVAENAPARDGFDDWVQVRDKRLDNSVSARYVSPGVIGYQDLDSYGRWEPTPSYGNVWVPYSVAADWAPYRFGHWVWIAPWGWTWVDDAPWGFAPFHYGRWVNWGGGWAWAPGPRGYWNPYYAPALVGWVGGPGFSVGFSFGSVGIGFGWFPLGWGEPFYPRYSGWGHGGWYRGGGYVTNNYFRNVNVTNTNITNITNITNNYYRGKVGETRYGFRNRPGAVTAAPQSAFASGAPINRVGGAVPKADLGRGALLRGVDVNPTHESVLGGRAPQTRGVPPASAFNRPVITNNRPNIRPANLQAANEATLAHSNPNTLNRGGTVNATGAPDHGGRPPMSGAANNPRVNGAGNVTGTNSAPVKTPPTQAMRGPENNGTPTSTGGHYVPRPPSAGGSAAPPSSHSTTGIQGTPTHNVPHTPATGANSNPKMTSPGAGVETGTPHNVPRPGNDSYARPTNGAGPVTGYNQHVGNPEVPRSPQTYQPGHPVTTTPHVSTPSQPSKQAAPESSPKSTPHNGNSPKGSGSAMSAPRPPAGYSYRAPATSGFSGRSAPVTSGYSAGRSTYTPTPSYNAPQRSMTPSYTPNRGSYSSGPAYPAAPSNQANRGYSAPQANRGNSAPPAYSSRNMGSYSAPRSSGGGATGNRAPSAGGSRAAVGGAPQASGGGQHGR